MHIFKEMIIYIIGKIMVGIFTILMKILFPFFIMELSI